MDIEEVETYQDVIDFLESLNNGLTDSRGLRPEEIDKLVEILNEQKDKLRTFNI